MLKRSRSFQLFAAFAACLLSLVSPGTAVGHAMVHAHWAADHAGGTPFEVPTMEDGEHGHDHEHVAADKAAAPRDAGRIDVGVPVVVPYVALFHRPPAEERATYDSRADSAPVNYNTHGEPPNPPKGFYHGYGKGTSRGEQGELVSAFDGSHGWFWRNRSASDVRVTLLTSGEYQQLREMK